MPEFNPCPPLVLADDNPDDLFFLQRELRKAGVNNPVLSFPNGKQVIDFFEAELGKANLSRPQAFLIDVKMPLRTGFEVLTWIRQQAVFVRCPVILLSGSFAESDRRKAEALSANAYFVKSSNTLPDIVREVVARGFLAPRQ